MEPPAASMILYIARVIDDLPAPVLPIIPIYKKAENLTTLKNAKKLCYNKISRLKNPDGRSCRFLCHPAKSRLRGYLGRIGNKFGAVNV